jgi:PAS domain S-box-containing protein
MFNHFMSNPLSNSEQLKEQIEMLQHSNELLLQQNMELEKDLLESNIRLDQFYKAAFEGIIVCKGNQILLVNETLCQLFGYNHDEVIQLNVIDLITPEYQKTFLAEIEDRFAEAFETIGIKQDGTTFPIKIRAKAVPYQGIDYTAVVVQDITYDKKVEQELIESVLRYRKLFEESNDAIYISAVSGKLLEVNQAWLDLFGYNQEDVDQVNTIHLYANPDDRAKFTQELARNGSVGNYEITLVKKNEEQIECILSTTTRKNMDGEIIGYQGIIRDITEKKRTAELIKAKELAEKSATMKEQFLANMSHEIRTPMNAVIGFTNLLNDSTLTTEQRKYLDGIRHSSEHLLVLINDILDFSKIEAGRLVFEKIDFSLPDLLNNIHQTFKFKAHEKNIEFRVNAEDTLPTTLIGDPTRILQILLNLVSNALKFTQKGAVIIDVRLFSEDAQTAIIAFSVTDTGMGIAADKLPAIFDSFTQVSTSTTRKFGGTGLGLAITKKLVEMQGGTISVKSEVGRGSSFIFVIKFKKGNDNFQHTHTIDSTIADQEMLPLGKLRILLVEDNELNQVVAVDTIRKWGKDVQIDIAENGRIALDKLQQQRYDIVLMDVQMPEMDGIEATRQIRTTLSMTDLPILAMTAYATSGEAERTIMAGMNDYISKPFNPKKLYKKIVQLTHVQQINTPNSDTIDPSTPALTIEQTRLTNLAFLDEAVGGDAELKAKMLGIIMRETPEEIAKMDQHYNEQNWDRLQAAAHKFKSAVTYLGMDELKEIVKRIQTNAETRQNLNDTADLIYKVKKDMAIAMDELDEEMKMLPKVSI